MGLDKMTPVLAIRVAGMLATKTNREISIELGGIVSSNQVQNIRTGRAWSDATGIEPNDTGVTEFADRQPNIKSTDPRHALFAPTQSINDAISLRVRALLHERGIKASIPAAVLHISQSALSAKLYRDKNSFSTAQLLILRETLFPDVDIAWLMAGKHDPVNPPEYAKTAEFFELSELAAKLIEAGRKQERERSL